jgi:hypothetical protein
MITVASLIVKLPRAAVRQLEVANTSTMRLIVNANHLVALPSVACGQRLSNNVASPIILVQILAIATVAGWQLAKSLEWLILTIKYVLVSF